jgi:hypothetical protein
MRTRCGRAVMVGMVLVGLLTGCATTVAQQDTVGLPTAENPEYLGHPFRLVALPLHFVGNILRYGLIEPFYFAMNTMPNAVGLSLEEQRYLQERQETWAREFEAFRALPPIPAK